VGDGRPAWRNFTIRLTQPSLAGVGAGLDNNREKENKEN